MSKAMDVIQQVYAAFGRGDVPGILGNVADEVDWEFVGPADLAYARRRRNKAEVEQFFADVTAADEIFAFEPREFIDGGDNVTVLGTEKSRARETGRDFETEWMHVFTVKQGKITRWRGFFDTAARYR